jgi:hypothetical protein
MKNKDFFNLGLPKLPALIVKGEKITPEQASEIIIRTNGDSSCNDNEFSNRVAELIYDVKIPDHLIHNYDQVNTAIEKKLGIEEEVEGEKWEKWSKVWGYRDEKRAELEIIELSYLDNSQICSSWIGGPHGWCDWEGNIGCSNYNIGKWPGVEEVYNEWKSIAKAFPFLDLRCQLANHEASSPEMSENPGPVVEFIVKAGKVKMVIPKDYIEIPEFGPIRNIGDRDSEIGCTIEKLNDALEMVREKKRTREIV